MKTECRSDYVKLSGELYPCTVSLTMALVGGKWKAVILYHLMEGPKRYSELSKQMKSITEMTLSLQLKQLEKDGLLTRTVFGKKPPVKVLYQLTAFGKSFSPVLKAITDWGNQVATQRGEFVSQID
ncbi:DNA-binding transcriptional regulator, HxlR family [Arachidicoccus rhizosphaerae]|uniref:DNA-binding transcriptional regulator, HxlR family n=1 Tax=Arachidicoccus rhizosphaerae TaxID=551991 RepID=A0A1H3WHL7_9BACT|nr:helix-turn-helix domain-containing protein [Arachidicoccus rhizosphaerae]SDZ86603.1 DNA-binding transcriptional regulator, HxlR family [Arachidicoccus rhizosphaerae]